MVTETTFHTREEEREKLLTALYKKTFPAVAKYIHRMGGSLEEAKDVFHDALVLYYEKKLAGNDSTVLNEQAYVVGTVKHLWAKRFKDKNHFTSLSSAEETISSPKEELPSSEKILQFLESSGQKCMELLRAFYYDKISPDKLAESYGFSGVRSATVQKYKCLEKVRNSVKEKSLDYEDFLD